jgi:hypothetical protein
VSRRPGGHPANLEAPDVAPNVELGVWLVLILIIIFVRGLLPRHPRFAIINSFPARWRPLCPELSRHLAPFLANQVGAPYRLLTSTRARGNRRARPGAWTLVEVNHWACGRRLC